MGDRQLWKHIRVQFPERWSLRRRKWHAELAKELYRRGFDPLSSAIMSRTALAEARIRFGDKDYHWGTASIQIFAEELSRDD